jgi:hypothetical protein
MSASDEEFLRSLRPVVEAFGAAIIAERSTRPGDFPVQWQGRTIAHVRPAELHGALGRLIATVERDTGCDLSLMARADKQAAVRRLDEQGAFLLRGAVDDVASRMGVSRVTLYTYLNAIQAEGG